MKFKVARYASVVLTFVTLIFSHIQKGILGEPEIPKKMLKK
ncbi:cyclic lactone autoinducer peptide [Chengkuizengella axinellae]|uniref:Cyclic lactone autoinducer peptide n=1 Tax=Chengkuizengella axinellae TaxID=3064388 RepID=A0ABT9ITE9_9BACL|nr:cyclic lactone autoinducer peptide [Chengkuizengella sp. 2205SS18-9]MDP5272557.1 cyclic lactone autoinducer peptide [Chengkuizengella sp. 2205SS18-9]